MIYRSDSDIQRAVRRELAWDTRLEDPDIRVRAEGGTVTLTGSVRGHAQRVAAQEAAHRVYGVLDVVNDIEVRVPRFNQRGDVELAKTIRSALAWDDLVPDARIETTVSNGWVTLSGEVQFRSEREDAEHAVRNIVGVRGITNALRVEPPVLLAEEIEEAIEGALARRAEREAHGISVEVTNGGRVVLSGTVHSLAERDVAIEAAERTPGVRSVESKVRVVRPSRRARSDEDELTPVVRG